MKVILKDSKQVKDVSFGYAVNYLIPQGLAVAASKKELDKLEKVKKSKDKASINKEKENKALVNRFKDKKVSIKAKSSTGDRIFGSVTKRHILKALNLDPNRVEVLLDEPIKKLGNYDVGLKIGNQETKIKIKVEEEKDKDKPKEK
jgi:large subunit ribosomal protein L9